MSGRKDKTMREKPVLSVLLAVTLASGVHAADTVLTIPQATTTAATANRDRSLMGLPPCFARAVSASHATHFIQQYHSHHANKQPERSHGLGEGWHIVTPPWKR